MPVDDQSPAEGTPEGALAAEWLALEEHLTSILLYQAGIKARLRYLLGSGEFHAGSGIRITACASETGQRPVVDVQITGPDQQEPAPVAQLPPGPEFRRP